MALGLLVLPRALTFQELLPKTDSTFHSPVPGSPSDDAQEAIARKFPVVHHSSFDNGIISSSKDNNDHYNHPALLVVLESTNHSSLVDDSYAKHFSLQLSPFLNQQLRNSTNGTMTNDTNLAIVQVSSYYGYEQANLHLLAESFMSADEQTTLLQVAVLPNHDVEQGSFHPKHVLRIVMQALDDYCSSSHSKQSSFRVGLTGLDYFSRDLRLLTKSDLHRMHVHVLPLALMLVARTLMYQGSGSTRSQSNGPWCSNWNQQLIKMMTLVMITICCMLSTVSTWSWILNRLILPYMQVTQFTPSIMMSLTLAMGMDYTLFLMARFLTEQPPINAVSTPEETMRTTTRDAMEVMLEQAGQVVVVSGTTLICTFLGLVALPLSMLQSIGIGAAIAISSAMVMNLLVIPSLLCTPCIQRWLQKLDVPPQDDTIGDIAELAEPLLVDHAENARGESPANRILSTENDSIWMCLARQVIHPYKSIIIVLVILQILLIPVAWNSRRIDPSNISFFSLLPHAAPSVQVYDHLIHGGGFSAGKLAPFRMLLDGTKSNTSMDTSQAFALQHDLVTSLMAAGSKLPGTNGSIVANFAGISVAKQSPIPYTIYEASQKCVFTNCTSDALRCLHELAQELLSEDRLATIIMVELKSASPFDKEGVAWLDETRRQIDLWMTKHPGVDVYVEGVAGVAHDAVNAVYASFTQVLGTSILVVFGLLGLVFRSIVPPLRSIVSITFTLAVSYGMTVLVYQDGIFGSWHLRSLTAVDQELSWLVPIMSFSIMVGLALDYDIFLITRVSEFRFLEGYSHQSSIAAGLDATGGVITSAGLIMAVSFGSLLASQSPALDQWAFVVTFSVLLDTFVVRTIFVPALMTWTGEKYSWYPRRLPIATVTLAGFDNHRRRE